MTKCPWLFPGNAPSETSTDADTPDRSASTTPDSDVHGSGSSVNQSPVSQCRISLPVAAGSCRNSHVQDFSGQSHSLAGHPLPKAMLGISSQSTSRFLTTEEMCFSLPMKVNVANPSKGVVAALHPCLPAKKRPIFTGGVDEACLSRLDPRLPVKVQMSSTLLAFGASLSPLA